MKYKIAIASKDGIEVNEHFGKANFFYIAEADREDMTIKYLEKRNVTPVCRGGHHNDEELLKIIRQLKDCQYVLVSKIGFRAENLLAEHNITAFEITGCIEESVEKLLCFIVMPKVL